MWYLTLIINDALLEPHRIINTAQELYIMAMYVCLWPKMQKAELVNHAMYHKYLWQQTKYNTDDENVIN